MPTVYQNISQLYSKIAQNENTRLAEHPMERELTLRTIRHWLPTPTAAAGTSLRIADIGGGPGFLAFTLADEGHHVDLIDLTPELIALAVGEQERRRSAAGSEKKNLLASITIGNALERSALMEGTYDAVLLLGPLYHLVDEVERQLALKNALRLAKPDGTVFCAFVSMEAHLRDIAIREPGRLVNDKAFYDKYLGDGLYEKFNSKLGVDVQSFHAHSRDIRPFIERSFSGAVELVDLRSVEGILGGGLDIALASASEDIVQAWAEVMFERYSADKEYLRCADHLVAVLKRV